MKRFLVLLIVCIACKPAPPPPKKTAAAGPQVRATVVTIRTTVDKRTIDQALVIAEGRARFTAENDTWRLFDTKKNTVTFVDDVEKTIRTEPLAAILARRSTTNAVTIPLELSPARFVRMNDTKQLQGTTARAAVIESGAYRRELWLAEHPSIPRGLFAMMHVSEKQSSPLAPMMKAVDAALATERGFPLLDRATLGNDVIIERAVTAIAQRDVPESVIVLPKGYKDVTPAPVARNPQR
ncbi:MAG TPA: hypothetical protein VM733_02415 [Thermoanaerobaculia bacterium]|nr:hypothetical protein [Thermoanaerobaculia bacterium]